MHLLSQFYLPIPSTLKCLLLFKIFNTPISSLYNFSTSFPSNEISKLASATLPSPNQALDHLIKTCSTLSQLKQVHAQIITHVLSPHASLSRSLLRAYASFRNLGDARILFDRHPLRCTFVWNAMIQAYSKTDPQEALLLFRRTRSMAVLPDNYTFTFVISACSHLPLLEQGQSFHAHVVKSGYECDTFVRNSLVNMYSVFMNLEDARQLFDEMVERDVVSWTSLVGGYAKRGEVGVARLLFDQMPERNNISWAVMTAGYVQNGLPNDALYLFHKMLRSSEAKPNEAVLVSVLSACAHLGALDQGKWIHLYIDKNGIPQTSNISTTLIDMYAKCGRLDCAHQVFDKIPKPDVLLWTSMITGLAMHGHGKEAVEFFSRMLAVGNKPDSITLVGVLNGCSHSGLVDEGCSIFYDMDRLWGIVPTIKHYGCLIDLLSRAGQLAKAFEIAKTMPMEPDIIAWRALLSACRLHGNVNLGEQIMGHIAQLEPNSHGGGYVLLSNMYASIGRWDRVVKARKSMSERGIESVPGCSWIELDGVVHEFLASDKLHPQIVEIHCKLEEVLKRASSEGGYVPNTMGVLFDLSEEDKEQAVSWHSEKLAVAFGLMKIKEGSGIRVVKNLRICEDCHSAMKALSKAFQREIIVRDRSRFHTFKAGQCSCLDYW